jgi:O-antigen/teichoic acid export membrane protein
MEIEKEKSSHETILKATGILGSIQVAKLLVGAIGAKCIAVFLGPIGFGMVGLLYNMLAIIGSLTSFGTNVSLSREVTIAKTLEDKNKIANKLSFLQKWSLYVGVFGALVTIVFSPFISKLTFGTTSKYYWFLIVAVNFIFLSLTNYRTALLQGHFKAKRLAISGFISSFLITLISIPLYYFLKQDAILPVIITSGIVGLGVMFFYTRDISISRNKETFFDSFKQGKELAKMGFLLSINVIFGLICSYIIKLYLNSSGRNTIIVGYYEVSNVILVSYVGIIFTAMGTDFYPRLTAIHKDKNKLTQFVNDQIDIGLLLVTPLIILFYIVSPFLITILYSQDFINVQLIFKAALFAVIIKAIIWPLAFIILAKGEKRLYFKQELLGDFLNVTLTLLMFQYLGLKGIGIAMVFNYTIYGIYVYTLLRKKFEFFVKRETLKIIIVSLTLGLASCIIVFFDDVLPIYFLLLGLLAISITYSYFQLTKRIDFKLLFSKIKTKIKGDK